jgi:hypothetical protein
MKREIFNVTTAADGTATVTAPTTKQGLIYTIEYVKNNFADGIDFVLNAVQSDQVDLIYTGTNVNASVMLAPRIDAVGNTGTAVNSYNVMIPFFGKLQIVVAQGGNATTGKFIVTYLED